MIAAAPMSSDGYGQLPAILERFERSLQEQDACYRLLGSEWSGIDHIGPTKRAVVRILRTAGDAGRKLMMTDEEQAALAALPKVLTVYRGCYSFNRNGLSWSLDPRVACRFPLLSRFDHRGSGDTPLLLTARVRRDRCVLKLDGGEVEIIAPQINATATTEITDMMAAPVGGPPR